MADNRKNSRSDRLYGQTRSDVHFRSLNESDGSEEGRSGPSGRRRSSYTPSSRRRKKSRGTISIGGQHYTLVHPWRLVLMILLLVALIIAIVSCISSGSSTSGTSGGSSSSEASSASASTSSSSSAAGQTSLSATAGAVITADGTVRSVQASSTDTFCSQLAAYMAAMVYSNPNNYTRTSSVPNGEAGSSEIDLSPYRYVVAINAGSGGSDTGYVSGDTVEKQLTLSMAQEMVDYLNQKTSDYYFLLIRSADTTMTDAQRLRVVETYDADLVVSLYFNSSDIELGGTIGTYYSSDPAEDGTYSERDQQSMSLAQQLMDAASEGFGMWSREIEYDDTDPMLKTDCPSAAVYMGFFSYEHDLLLIQDTSLQKAAADNLAEVVLAFCDENAPEKTRGQIAQESAAQEILDSSSDSAGSGTETSAETADSGTEDSAADSTEQNETSDTSLQLVD